MRTQGFALSSGTLRAGVFGFQARVWFAGLLGAFVGIGCDNAQETERDAPRDVEGAADSAADGEVTAGDTAAVDVADTAQGDSGDAAAADTKACPPGAQIEGCPCTKPVLGQNYGCCLGINWGLTCSMYQGAYVWGVTWDCCTKEAPYCGDKPPSGKNDLCNAKYLP